METKKRNFKTLTIILGMGLLIQILFDPLSDLAYWGRKIQTRVALPAAREKWEAHHIDHYKIDITMMEHNGLCIWQANLEIKDGLVIAKGRRSDWPADLSTLDVPVFPVFEPKPDSSFLCNYHNFTIPRLFDQLEESLQKNPFAAITITYDKEYGYISHVLFGRLNPHGLLRNGGYRTPSWLSLENLQILDK